ncbi:ABC transporter substrate-binding protein [Streptomyces sp. NPDC096310]|uniref:ABC transporter substrate-binding protein n=1 Tax=Streptomyces sp. NPDC096310 TaxID=3366082 RepID=UPI00382BED84
MPSRKPRIVLTVATVLIAGLTGCSTGGSDSDELTINVANTATDLSAMDALSKAFVKKNPGVKIDVEPRPQGTDGESVVKTRLNSGDLGDLMMYNSGALLGDINPDRNLVKVTEEAWAKNTSEPWHKAASVDKDLYGAPVGGSSGGGILYNRDVYDKLKLKIPKTWDELINNAQVIKEAGLVPFVQTYKDNWTAQFFVLANYHNVQVSVPGFADQWTEGRAKFADTPAAMAGFEHLQQVHELGLTNKDYATATYDQGQQLLASGKAAMYPQTTSAVRAMTQRYPAAAKDIGLFPIPGDAPATYGLTTWQPQGLYIMKASEKQELAKKFVAFVASPEGCDAYVAASGATGISPVSSCKLPDNATQAVKDMVPFVENGDATPALEFLSPVATTSLADITVAVGSGLTSAAKGAKQYDDAAAKSAKQLGIKGW